MIGALSRTTWIAAGAALIVVVVALVWLFSGPSASALEQQAEAADKKGDFKGALKLYTQAAEAGSVDAQLTLGVKYNLGDMVKQNYPEAAKWLAMAAASGNQYAEYDIGNSYLYGQGVTKNETTAASWFLKASDQANAPAEYNLGILYAQGHGVQQDVIQSFRWLNRAVAHYPMGDDQNAAAQAVAVVAKHMSPEQIAEAQALEDVASDPVLNGTWSLPIHGGRWILEIDSGGTYKFHSEAPDGVGPHAGSFSAIGGYWSLRATNGYMDGGPFNLPSHDVFSATGKLGLGNWQRCTVGC